jgi:hypothetical protein
MKEETSILEFFLKLLSSITLFVIFSYSIKSALSNVFYASIYLISVVITIDYLVWRKDDRTD